MEKIALILFAVVAAALAGPSDPEPRPDPNWLARHEGFKANTAANPGIPCLFYGDSITDAWSSQAEWRNIFSQRGCVNYGIGGDQVQHLTWRVMDGEIDGLNPAIMVLKIGTNNLGGATAEQIADGIKLFIDTVRAKTPNVRILLLSILPRNGEANYLKIAQINIYISKFHNGNNVWYQNIFDNFGEVWGTVDSAIFPDGLHLSAAGYTRWYNVMSPWFFALCNCAAP
jgi:lysophospholipase L1-like esterase